ncbi:Hypothetical predicted protein [Marmota monax]|uniref:Uncharacterized protein n=1 Tax=Marmota monax TaxID=9995 RepID=A0A5E4BPX2_MARMO|nr:hypothetical protein GHT09_009437 [Marmota monax]VTJ71495.1 Hypothetical predicted protein [Marmota monax]
MKNSPKTRHGILIDGSHPETQTRPKPASLRSSKGLRDVLQMGEPIHQSSELKGTRACIPFRDSYQVADHVKDHAI